MATMATAAPATPAPRVTRQEPEWMVWIVVAVALILGVLIMLGVVNKTQSVAAGATTVQYPASWVKITEPGTTFAAGDIDNGGPFGARIALREVETSTLAIKGGGGVSSAANVWVLKRGKDLIAFRVLSVGKTYQLNGHEAVDVESAYLLEAGQGATGVPAVMHAVDTLVAAGGKYEILTFSAEESQFPQLSDLHAKLLADWKLP